jgi:hypothetical protein
MTPQVSFDSSEEEDPFNSQKDQSYSPTSKVNNYPSKIPIMKNSNLRSSLDNLEESGTSSYSLTESPRLMETMRQITRLETPIKKIQNQTNSAASPNVYGNYETPRRSDRLNSHGFVVTPFDSKVKYSSVEANKAEPPSSEEFLKKLAATREQFNQDINSSIQSRISPKILANNSLDDGWKGMSEISKNSNKDDFNQRLFSSSKLGNFKEESNFETESLNVRSNQPQYEETRLRLERIRQKSKEILSTKSSTWSLRKDQKPGFFCKWSVLTWFCLAAFLASTIIYYGVFSEQKILNFLQ